MRRETMGFGIALTCLAPLARADEVAAAKVLFDQGVAKMQAQNYEAGCKQIEESLRLDRRPGTLYTLATCEFGWGRWATATARYDEFLTLFEKLPESKKPDQEARAEDARNKRDQIAPDVPRWTISLAPSAPPNTAVKRNGDVWSTATFGVEMPVDPGVYVWTTQAPGGPVTEKRVNVVKGTRTTVVLEVAPVPAANKTSVLVQPTTGDKPTHPRRVAGAVVMGIGGAVLGGGLVAGAVALSYKDTIDANCGAAVGVPSNPTACGSAGKAAGESAQWAATLSTVGVIAGAVGLAAGIVVFASAPSSRPANKDGPVKKLDVSVWSANFSGAMGGVRGTW